MLHQFLLFTTTSWFLASLLLLPLIWLAWKNTKKWFFAVVSPKGPPLTDAIISQASDEKWPWLENIDRIFLVVFVGWFLGSFAFRLQPYGYDEWIAFTVGPFLYLTLSRSSLQDWWPLRPRLAAWIITIISSIMSLHGLILFLFQHTSRLSGIFQGDEIYTTYPNALAMFLLMVLPFQVYLLVSPSRLQQLRKTGFFQRGGLFLIAAIGFVLNFMAFILTFSRGAFLALITTLILVLVGSFIFYFQKKKRISFIQGRFFLLLVTLSAIAFAAALGWNEWHRSLQPVDLARQVPLTEDIVSRFDQQNHSADQSSQERIEFWRGAIALIRQYPWFGVGSDGFRFQYPRFQRELLATSTHPHNLFLKLAVENGLPAAFFFGLFLLSLFLLSLKKMDENGDPFFRVVLLVTFLAVNIHLLVDYNLNAMALWLGYWLLLTALRPAFSIDGKKMSMRSVHLRSFFQNLGLLVRAAFLFFLIGMLVLSVVFFSHYRMVKGNNLTLALLQQLKTEPFQPLIYEQIGQMAADGRFQHTQLAPFVPLFEQELREYPQWPELKIALARILFALKDFENASRLYAEALDFNQLNNLDWHAEYLNSLHKSVLAADQVTLHQKEDFYFELMTHYLQKLKNNDHNTLATQDPVAGLQIIDFYLRVTPLSSHVRWQNLKTEYADVWLREAMKFRSLFPTAVPTP